MNNIQKVWMTVKVDEKSMNLKFAIKVLIHNKKQIQSMGAFTSNDIGIPSIETGLATPFLFSLRFLAVSHQLGTKTP